MTSLASSSSNITRGKRHTAGKSEKEDVREAPTSEWPFFIKRQQLVQEDFLTIANSITV